MSLPTEYDDFSIRYYDKLAPWTLNKREGTLYQITYITQKCPECCLDLESIHRKSNSQGTEREYWELKNSNEIMIPPYSRIIFDLNFSLHTESSKRLVMEPTIQSICRIFADHDFGTNLGTEDLHVRNKTPTPVKFPKNTVVARLYVTDEESKPDKTKMCFTYEKESICFKEHCPYFHPSTRGRNPF